MLNLSDRLKCIAGKIPEGFSVADIGTDHGFLPLFLLEQGISKKVIATDISKGSLEKAKSNSGYDHHRITAEEIDKGLIFRLGDGLDVIDRGEVDAVVMAGIGGQLIAEILDWDIFKVSGFKLLILQPRNNSGKLRYFLKENGFIILEEELIPEGKRFSEIIVCRTGEELVLNISAWKLKNLDMDFTQYDYPDTLTLNGNDITVNYIENRLNEERRILDNIKSDEPGEIDEEKRRWALEYREKRVARLESFLKAMRG